MPFDIVVARATSAIDPDLSAAVAPNRRPIATPTSGSNRHTTFVPSESTTWSLGTSVMTMEDSKIEYKTSGDVDFNNKGLVKVTGRKVLLG